ncbi:MAG: phosphomethylpyrimidine synthase ThiC [Kiritimatiellae bacterium]|nr:phosphomethylpyrimidine synthase ThiC [Kiritimatiellia bacterium]
MKTQFEHASEGTVTVAMQEAAAAEGVSVETVREELAAGRAVLPANPRHRGLVPLVVGRRFRTKVNANIGCSTESSSPEQEMAKLRTALEAGADFVMDLSLGPSLASIRKAVVNASPRAVGTVPIYEAFDRARNDVRQLSAELLLQCIREQAEDGIDFMTLHAGLLRHMIPLATKRVMGIVSRGGAILAEWMTVHGKENPLYAHWDDVMSICHEYDVTVSLGDGLRPGCLADASDEAQFAELDVLGELVARCRRAGVQVMVEGPGHIPFDQIKMNIERQQIVCAGAPFYVLGPVVTDIAPGHDHITASIGATAAAYYGAALICYVTPAEHLALPCVNEVREGVIASRIAAHAADVARGVPGARERDDKMAQARMRFDWTTQFELALDPVSARTRFETENHSEDGIRDHCSMCGREFCAIRATKRIQDYQDGSRHD